MDEDQYSKKSFVWSSHTVITQIFMDKKIDSILDVGSGGGFFGESLSYKPRELCAIDRRRLSLPEIYSFFWREDLDSTNFSFLENKTFQAVVLADVVEHLRNPQYVVSKLVRHLDPDGFIIFSFPNMGFFLVRILTIFGIRPKMERGLYDRTHLHDFDLETARQFLKSLELEILELRVTPVPLPLLSSLFKEGSSLFFLYKGMNFLAKKFPNLFAYQFIFKVKRNEA